MKNLGELFIQAHDARYHVQFTPQGYTLYVNNKRMAASPETLLALLLDKVQKDYKIVWITANGLDGKLCIGTTAGQTIPRGQVMSSYNLKPLLFNASNEATSVLSYPDELQFVLGNGKTYRYRSWQDRVKGWLRRITFVPAQEAADLPDPQEKMLSNATPNKRFPVHAEILGREVSTTTSVKSVANWYGSGFTAEQRLGKLPNRKKRAIPA